MDVADPDPMGVILDQIKAWPVPSRITLARRILESVEQAPAAEQPPGKTSLRDLVGMLKTEGPPPTDEECRAILEDELIKKHLR